MKRQYLFVASLLIIASIKGCRPDDKVICDGVPPNIVYELDSGRTEYIPMFSVDTLKFKRTNLNTMVEDEVVMVKVSEEIKRYPNGSFSRFNCRRAFWDTDYIFIYQTENGAFQFKQTYNCYIREFPEHNFMITNNLILQTNNNDSITYPILEENQWLENGIPLIPYCTVLGKQFDFIISRGDLCFQPNFGVVRFSDRENFMLEIMVD